MPRRDVRDITKTSASPDAQIVALVQSFQQDPYNFFNEQDLHGKFFSLCHDTFPKCGTRDRHQVSAFRHAYPTFWRYRQGDHYARGHLTGGSAGTFDFVVLRYGMVVQRTLVDVMNHDEQQRHSLVHPPKDLIKLPHRDPIILSPWNHASAMVQCAVELKMAQLRDKLAVTDGDVNRLEDAMLESCRKLALERIDDAFVLGFSHGPLPDLDRARSIIFNCLSLHGSRFPKGRLRVAIVLPTQTVPSGNWSDEYPLPNALVPAGLMPGSAEVSPPAQP